MKIEELKQLSVLQQKLEKKAKALRDAEID